MARPLRMDGLRFKAIVDRAGWGLELSRYVYLNPVWTARMGLDKRGSQGTLGTLGSGLNIQQ